MLSLDPCPPPSSIRHHLQASEDRSARVWRFEVRVLRQVTVSLQPRLSIPHSETPCLGSILRAFLVEEAKIVKKVIKSQQKTAK